MKAPKRILGFFLCLVMLLSIVPAQVLAADHDVYTLTDDYIKVDVSRVNGGFLISTVEGNRLKKSDNNKELLYHNGQYDTSFVSFRLGEGTANQRDYIFGGKYTDQGSTAVTVTQSGDSIVAAWGVEGITFTQTISLAAQNSQNSGMVSIGLSVAGTTETVKARVLLDTCLGNQDWGYYQTNSGTLNNTLYTEQIITDAMEITNFYAVDDFASPAIQARMVSTPTQVSIGHWNHLASSLYDFVPTASLNFTNPINEYQTADSAAALYYDLKATDPVNIYYGVYSNWNVLDTERFAVNLSAPMRLDLNEARNAFVPQAGMPEGGIADFSVHVSAENYLSATSRSYSNVVMAINSTSGICPLDDEGKQEESFPCMHSDAGFKDPTPMVIPYGSATNPIKEGDTIEKTLYFKAKLQDSASFERITITFYDNTNGDFSASTPLMERILGYKVVYILLPGNDGDIPKIQFAAMSPKTIYNEGMRHLYVSVANADLMETALESGMGEIYAISADKKTAVKLDENLVSFNDGVADVVISNEEKLAVGSWHLQLRWTDAAVAEGIVTAAFQKQTAQVLEFEVSSDPKFRNDCYGVLAAVKYGGTGTASVDDTYRYELRNFKDEADFTKFSKKVGPYAEETYKEILLVYRGNFIGDRRYPLTDDYGRIIGYRYYTAVSKETIKDGKATVDSTVTINNCVDFEAGTISVYYEDYAVSETAAKESPILCEFDGKLYTSVERTSIWTGMAALTKLEKGQNISLIKYDKNGVRTGNDASASPITLIWPNVFGYAQKLAGIVFKMAYGQFGVMYHEGREIGRVIGFAAGFNFNQFMKDGEQEDDTAAPDTYFGRMKELWTDWRGASLYQYAYHGNRFNKLTDISMNDSKEDHENAQKGVAVCVMVPDILFGCGQGFVGLHFTVELVIQNVIDSLPKIKGKLEVNTIGDWSFGVEGSCKLAKFSMEAKLSFKSKDNIPIPDEIYFFIGGFKPGINVDGCGTVWLKGLGGGISNIYDTIFMTSGLPPLKLTVAAAFSIIQVMDGKAKLELSLSGFKLSATDLKFADTIEVIRSITLGLQWYPDLNLQASIYVDMFEKTLCGNGYIVLIGKNYKDWEFEMFARIRLCIPESVPVVGGMTLLGIDVGIGTKKVWGAFTALCVSLGITYYWGESGAHFGTGGDFAQPSYPSLLTLNGYDDNSTAIPIGYDEETDRILYACIGTNLSPPVGAQILSDGDLQLLANGTPGVWSNLEKRSHKFNLGEYDEYNQSTLVQVNFQAESLDEAKTVAGAFTANSAQDGTGDDLPLSFVGQAGQIRRQGSTESDEDYEAYLASAEVQDILANDSVANASITYNPDTGLGTFAFSLTDVSQFDMDWYLNTGVAADVVLYNVYSLPKITSVAGVESTDYNGDPCFSVTCGGDYLYAMDRTTFYLTKGNSDPMEDGYPLGSTDYLTWDEEDYPIPVDLPSGEYYIRAVYSMEGMVNGVVWSTDTITYVNPNEPAEMGIPMAAPCGDLKFYVSIPASDDANTTGYIVEILDENGEPTDLSEMRVDRAVAEDGTPMATTFQAGGRMDTQVPVDPEDPDAGYETVTTGLTAGQQYKLRITPFHSIEPDGDTGTNGAVLYGTAYTTDAMLLPEAVTPTVTLTGGGKTLTSVAAAAKLDAADPNYEPLTFTGSSITLNAVFSEPVTGTWSLDGSGYWDDWGATAAPTEAHDPIAGAFSGSTAEIVLKDLVEGSHLLTITGQADDGDAFTAQYAFDVDTLAPRLMIQTPLNGSPFNEDGTVTISGITDPYCTLHVRIDSGAENTYLFTPDVNISTDGWFSVAADIPEADQSLLHYAEIWAVDKNGNATERKLIELSQPGGGKIAEYALMVNGAVPEGGGISTVSGVTDAQLQVVGVVVAADGTKSYFPVDNDYVLWHSFTAEGDAAVSNDGVLNCGLFTKGFVEARIEVCKRYELDQDTGEERMVSVYRTALLALVTDAMPGDLNGDNKVDVRDLVRLKKYVLGESVTLCASGDLYADGTINTKDLIQLQKYLLFENVELNAKPA